MRLNTFTDYSLRVLIYLALRNDTIVTRHEIAKIYEISDNHLMKVVNFLARRGYIETVRGKGGGMRLARSASDINIGEVVSDCETGTPFIFCFNTRRDAKRKCRLNGLCDLKDVFQKSIDAMFGVLRQYSLADVLDPKKPQIVRRLGIKLSAN